MTYYIARTLPLPFDAAVARLTEILQAEGFQVLTDIDVKATIKKKVDLDVRPYRLLGACKPLPAHRVSSAGGASDALLPCSVIVQEREDGEVEVTVFDPIVSAGAVDERALRDLAGLVRDKLAEVLDRL